MINIILKDVYNLTEKEIIKTIKFLRSLLPSHTCIELEKDIVINLPKEVKTNDPIIILNDSIDKDVTGIEWNPEIHSAKKTKTSDGKWRMKRNRNELEIEEKSIPLEIIPPPILNPEILMSFETLMDKIISLVKDSKILGSQVCEIIKELSKGELTSIPELASNPELIPRVSHNIDRLVEWDGINAWSVE